MTKQAAKKQVYPVGRHVIPSLHKGLTQVTTVRLTEDFAVEGRKALYPYGPCEEEVGIAILDAWERLGFAQDGRRGEMEQVVKA